MSVLPSQQKSLRTHTQLLLDRYKAWCCVPSLLLRGIKSLKTASALMSSWTMLRDPVISEGVAVLCMFFSPYTACDTFP